MKHRAFACVATFAAALSVSACGGAGTRSSTGGDIITLAEIQQTEARNALEVVQQLRPRWMVRSRGARSVHEDGQDFTRVVVDELPPDGFDVLLTIPREAIAEIRYLDAREATFQFGTGYNAGLIRVTTKH